MALPNRVTPFGEINASSARGRLMGNRGGRIHDPETKTLTRRRWASKRWIACRLDFKGRRREVMGAGYTELFFLDEATALAAGHRPCFECRRADAVRFAAAWALAHGLDAPPLADAMDRALHGERTAPLAARPALAGAPIPRGAMIALGDQAFLVTAAGFRRWSPWGYAEEICGPPPGEARLLTPPAIIAVLKAGYEVDETP